MSSPAIPQASSVMRLHDELLALRDWPQLEHPTALGGAWPWVAANHRFNALLWGEEDLARRTQVADAEIVANKRAIDRYNQARNDAIERIDEVLLLALGLVQLDQASGQMLPVRVGPDTRLNSETAGSMIDRLSIVALKLRAMRMQAERVDVGEAHRAASRERGLKLAEQRSDLAACLDALLRDVQAGSAWFKVYRQFKMYNDARFNPALAAEARRDAMPGAPS